MDQGTLSSPLLSGIPGLVHGFVPDARTGPPGIRRPRQVHGDRVVTVGELAKGATPEADAVLTRPGEPPVGVVTADCVPLLLVDPRGEAAVAVHAGWRGLAAGIVERAEAALRTAGARGPLVAAIGPAASRCCYETTVEIAGRLGARPERVRPSRPGHVRVDLRGVAKDRLGALGIGEERIELAGGCTICDPRWPSWRRDGERAERLLAFVGWKRRGRIRAGEER